MNDERKEAAWRAFFAANPDATPAIFDRVWPDLAKAIDQEERLQKIAHQVTDPERIMLTVDLMFSTPTPNRKKRSRKEI
jgi:hypothetical protein